MGATGKSISITIPIPLVEDLQKGANKLGISRSRFVSNLLLKWQESQKGLIEGSIEQTSFEDKPNDCGNREDDSFCIAFEHTCNANQKGADSCVGYVQKKEKL